MPPAAPLVPSVAGYFTPDGFRHAMAATSLGRLHEVFFSPFRGKGIDTLACFDEIRAIAGFFTADDGYQHEIIATTSGGVHEIFFKPGDIHFTEPPLGRFQDIVDVGAFHALDDDMRIVIVATADGNVREIFYHPSIGVHLTNPPLARFDRISSIAAFYTEDDRMRIVIVATQNGNLHEIFYNPTIGVHVSHPALAHFNGIVGVAAFYAEDDKMRIVIVATQDGNLHEIFYNPTIGVHVSQPALAHFNHITSIAAFYTPDDKFRHVIVGTADGAVHEVFYHPTIGVHVSQPALAQFPLLSPVLDDLSPDPGNLDAASLKTVNAGQGSTAGRTVSIAGDARTLYAFGQRSGVWKSIAGGTWFQLPGSPLEAQLFGPSPIAVDPQSSVHVAAGNVDGVWESVDGGFTWTLALDPTTQGWPNATSRTVHALAFGNDSTLYAGLDAGVANRAPGGSFSLNPVASPVTALAVSQTRVWARTRNAILSRSINGTWSVPVSTPVDVTFGSNQVYSLGAFDDFAYLCYSAADDPRCGATNWLLVFRAATGQWAKQRVDVGGKPTCDGTGGEVDGRKFVKTFVRRDAGLPAPVGQRLQLFYGAAQAIYQALGTNADGTVTTWMPIVGTQGPGFPNTDPVHADIWDFLIDVSPGGGTVWAAGDGGVYQEVLPNPYVFPGSGWTPLISGMHTHQVHTVTVLPTTPIARSRLVYSTSDNDFWYRGSTPIVMPDPKWQHGALGDVSWTVGDAAAPRFALAVRHQEAAGLIHYGGIPELTWLTLANFWKQRDPQGNVVILGGHVTVDGPTRFQFIPSPAGAGRLTGVDAVMMVDLPLVSFDKANNTNVPFNPGSPLGQSTNGSPVLIRNPSFDSNPDMNTSRGAGWHIEVAMLPSGATGFYVTGSRQSPQYYAFTTSEELFRRDGNAWTSILRSLLPSPVFGPAFVNPYDSSVIYALGQGGVLLSTDAGNSFQLEAALTALVAGPRNLPMSTVAQIAFNPENPREVAVGCVSGLFFSGGGQWSDLTRLLPRPMSTITSVGIDCEAIYVSTDARSLVRILNYRAV